MNTTLSPGSGVGITCSLVGSLCAKSTDRYPASRSSLTSFSVTEEASHLPFEPDPDMPGEFGGGGKDWNLGAGA